MASLTTRGDLALPESFDADPDQSDPAREGRRGTGHRLAR